MNRVIWTPTSKSNTNSTSRIAFGTHLTPTTLSSIGKIFQVHWFEPLTNFTSFTSIRSRSITSLTSLITILASWTMNRIIEFMILSPWFLRAMFSTRWNSGTCTILELSIPPIESEVIFITWCGWVHIPAIWHCAQFAFVAFWRAGSSTSRIMITRFITSVADSIHIIVIVSVQHHIMANVTISTLEVCGSIALQTNFWLIALTVIHTMAIQY